VDRCLPIRHVDSVQNQFSLLAQYDRPGFLDWLAERGIGYLGYGSLAYGLLTGAVTRDTRFSPDDWRSGSTDIGYYDLLFAPDILGEHLDRVDRLRDIADRLGVPLAVLALRAALQVNGVTGLIAGTRNPRHVRENAVAGDLELDDGTLREIDAIFAPE
jgi:aryl-alcohol dehydrogenase-like predicted oxidoreductase